MASWWVQRTSCEFSTIYLGCLVEMIGVYGGFLKCGYPKIWTVFDGIPIKVDDFRKPPYVWDGLKPTVLVYNPFHGRQHGSPPTGTQRRAKQMKKMLKPSHETWLGKKRC